MRIFGRRHFLGAVGLAGLAGVAAGGGAVSDELSRLRRDRAAPCDDTCLNVRSFGARGNGTSDDTAAIQKALDAAGKQGGNLVLLPSGRYLVRGSLVLPRNVTLQGVSRAPNIGAGGLCRDSSPTLSDQLGAHGVLGVLGGSVQLAVGGKGKPGGEPLVSLEESAALYGLTILYPEQTCPDPPVEYPWTVRQLQPSVAVVNVTILNPWQAVDCGTVTGGRHYIHGLYGQPLKTGLFIDKCEDVGRVTDVHFWPFWKPRAMEFTSRHTTAFLIGRTDWQYMVNCFAIAHKIGYHFVHTPTGAPNVLLTQCGSDEGAPGTKSISVLVESGKAGGVSFLNGQFGGSPSVYVTAGNTGTVKFTNCAFGAGPMTDSVVVLEDGIASFTNCRFSGWPRKAPTIVARGGGLMVQGCAFVSTGGRHVALERGAGAAVIVGNLFHGRMRIRNQIGNRAKIGLNAAS